MKKIMKKARPKPGIRRMDRAAKRLNAEASDALDYQTSDRPGFLINAVKRGRGHPRHTS
jgi:hypothetical protein